MAREAIKVKMLISCGLLPYGVWPPPPCLFSGVMDQKKGRFLPHGFSKLWKKMRPEKFSLRLCLAAVTDWVRHCCSFAPSQSRRRSETLELAQIRRHLGTPPFTDRPVHLIPCERRHSESCESTSVCTARLLRAWHPFNRHATVHRKRRRKTNQIIKLNLTCKILIHLIEEEKRQTCHDRTGRSGKPGWLVHYLYVTSMAALVWIVPGLWCPRTEWSPGRATNALYGNRSSYEKIFFFKFF